MKSKHPLSVRSRKWRASNPKASAAASLKWRNKHPSYWRKWGRTNPQKRRQYDKSFKFKNPNYHRNYYLQKVYGITLDDFWALFKAQKGRCPICLRPFSKLTMSKPDVDHCHKSGKFRALLCRRCNVTLGMVDDSVKILKQAIVYLKVHQNGRLH